MQGSLCSILFSHYSSPSSVQKAMVIYIVHSGIEFLWVCVCFVLCFLVYFLCMCVFVLFVFLFFCVCVCIHVYVYTCVCVCETNAYLVMMIVDLIQRTL